MFRSRDLLPGRQRNAGRTSELRVFTRNAPDEVAGKHAAVREYRNFNSACRKPQYGRYSILQRAVFGGLLLRQAGQELFVLGSVDQVFVVAPV